MGLVLGLVVTVMIQIPGQRAKMVVCDVGQGDAILITKGETQVLVDGGPSGEKILTCLGKQMPFYDRTIELIVLTNTDSDHLSGLSSVVERYKVIQFVTADGVQPSDNVTKLREKLQQVGLRVQPVERGDKLAIVNKLGVKQLEFKVLWPPDTIKENVAIFGNEMKEEKRQQILRASAKRGNLNERSVVLQLLEDKKRILLTGDAGDQTEKALLQLGGLGEIDILKVGIMGQSMQVPKNS